jgi:hypothetical protein
VDRTLTNGKDTYKRGNLEAVSPNYGTISNSVMQEGRFINEVDELHRRDVMVVGRNVVKALFPNRSQVAGSEVLMAGKKYEIVGVLEKRKGSFFGENDEDDADNCNYPSHARCLLTKLALAAPLRHMPLYGANGSHSVVRAASLTKRMARRPAAPGGPDGAPRHRCCPAAGRRAAPSVAVSEPG